MSCPYRGVDDCTEMLELDALAYIEQLEAAPAPAQDGLPKGWIEIHGDIGETMVVDASKVTSVEETCAVKRRIVRFAGTWIYASESVEEIMRKIREATT